MTPQIGHDEEVLMQPGPPAESCDDGRPRNPEKRIMTLSEWLIKKRGWLADGVATDVAASYLDGNTSEFVLTLAELDLDLRGELIGDIREWQLDVSPSS